MEKLAKLSTVFEKDGTVTAGNSCAHVTRLSDFWDNLRYGFNTPLFL